MDGDLYSVDDARTVIYFKSRRKDTLNDVELLEVELMSSGICVLVGCRVSVGRRVPDGRLLPGTVSTAIREAGTSMGLHLFYVSLRQGKWQ